MAEISDKVDKEKPKAVGLLDTLLVPTSYIRSMRRTTKRMGKELSTPGYVIAGSLELVRLQLYFMYASIMYEAFKGLSH